MSEIKFFVTHTPNRKNEVVHNELFYNVVAGSEFQKDKMDKTFLADNEGKNISLKNPCYCELTTQYWAWQNVKADYYGFCHYRRFFSFSDEKYQVSDSGVVIRKHINRQFENELCIETEKIRKKIVNYDFIVGQGIPTSAFGAKNLRDHYKRGKGLHEKDLDLMLDGIKELYPDIYPIALKYISGKLFYPCNMFVAKQKYFACYSKFLFDVLLHVEERMDSENYSREGYRTLGHLGERLLGIYYCYLKETSDAKLGELQIVQVENTALNPKIEKRDEIPIVLAANDNYSPVLSVCIGSIKQNISIDRKYHIYVLNRDIQNRNQVTLRDEFESENFKLSFVNVTSMIDGYQLKGKAHISEETYYRFLILDLFKDYKKVLYLDCDMIIRDNVAKLYDIDLKENLIGAVLDVDFVGQCNGANSDTRMYCEEVLKLENPLKYFQAGVLLFNIQELRKRISIEELLKMSEDVRYKYSDQDILNIVCHGKVMYFPIRWNVLTDSNDRVQKVVSFAPHTVLNEYEEARENPAIIHYAGANKPWKNPKEDFGKAFWATARESEYYEEILFASLGQIAGSEKRGSKIVNCLRVSAKKILPEGSWIRRKVGALYWKFK